VHLAEAAAEDGEVLAEDEHRPAVDRAVAGDDALAGGVELLAQRLDERAELDEAAGSSSASRRSRAVSLPAACCRAMRASPPPLWTRLRRSSISAVSSFIQARVSSRMIGVS
jgi:hypothetical protein